MTMVALWRCLTAWLTGHFVESLDQGGDPMPPWPR